MSKERTKGRPTSAQQLVNFTHVTGLCCGGKVATWTNSIENLSFEPAGTSMAPWKETLSILCSLKCWLWLRPGVQSSYSDKWSESFQQSMGSDISSPYFQLRDDREPLELVCICNHPQHLLPTAGISRDISKAICLVVAFGTLKVSTNFGLERILVINKWIIHGAA